MKMEENAALATGAASGIGKAAARMFAEAGASAMPAGRRSVKKTAVINCLYILTFMLFTLMICPGFVSCSPDDDPATPGTETPNPNPNPNPDPGPDPDPNPDPNPGNRLRISIGPASFTATLTDNSTAAAFKALLPMTVPMSEMNGNEKYCYLSGNLPTAASNPGTIRAGDLMLYGSNCVVLFYETFQTSYSYTRIGRVDNPSGLAAALGSGNVTVTFELI